jgi:hypothetical protein
MFNLVQPSCARNGLLYFLIKSWMWRSSLRLFVFLVEKFPHNLEAFRLFYERVQQKMTQRRARGRIFNQTQADKVSEVGRPLAAIQFGGLISQNGV